MILILLLLLAGIITGRLLRKKATSLKIIDRATSYSIYLLLFLMGISIGSNREIIGNLSILGEKALIITAFSLGGSILLAVVVYRLFFRNNTAIKE